MIVPLAIFAIASTLAAVYLYLRCRRLAATALPAWTWELRARDAMQALERAVAERDDETRLRTELVTAMAEASAELEDERDALVVRRDELLALVAKLSRETPYPAELDECRAARSKLIAEIGTLRATRDSMERQHAGRVTGYEAVIVSLIDDRDAHAARCVELAQLVSAMESAAPRETSVTVTEWANATLGEVDSNMSIWRRADKEFQELRRKLEEDDNHPGAAEECADVRIVLDRMVYRLGSDMQRETDRKMATNRARKWSLTGDGHGQHVSESTP